MATMVMATMVIDGYHGDGHHGDGYHGDGYHGDAKSQWSLNTSQKSNPKKGLKYSGKLVDIIPVLAN